jgi:chromosome segregation ATPase
MRDGGIWTTKENRWPDAKIKQAKREEVNSRLRVAQSDIEDLEEDLAARKTAQDNQWHLYCELRESIKHDQKKLDDTLTEYRHIAHSLALSERQVELLLAEINELKDELNKLHSRASVKSSLKAVPLKAVAAAKVKTVTAAKIKAVADEPTDSDVRFSLLELD